jgi:hypothetical protein
VEDGLVEQVAWSGEAVEVLLFFPTQNAMKRSSETRKMGKF